MRAVGELEALAQRAERDGVLAHDVAGAQREDADLAARAPADGYTLLLASAETHAIAPNLRAKLPYDPQRDFVAIAPFAINPFAIVSRPDFPAGTTRELVALAKSQPGKFTYSSAGLVGSVQMPNP